MKSKKESGFSDVTAEAYKCKDKDAVVNEVLSRENPDDLLIVHVLGLVF